MNSCTSYTRTIVTFSSADITFLKKNVIGCDSHGTTLDFLRMEKKYMDQREEGATGRSTANK